MKQWIVAAGLVTMLAGMTGCGRCPLVQRAAPADGKTSAAGGACCPGDARKTARLGILLPPAYRNPDGMTIRDGRIWLTINNVGQEAPSCIVTLTPDDRIEKVIDLPVNPATGVVSALGLVFASDGHLYVSDNQNLAGKGMGHSRVLRVVIEGGKAVRAEVVAVGLHAANGIAAAGDSLYVNETTFGEGDPMVSGTYRFKLAELRADAPVRVDGTPTDPHVIFTLKTRGPVKVGANGLCFDSAGNLYVANFGDREIWRLAMNADGGVASHALFTTVKEAESVDGMQYDGQGSIWFADFMGNAIFRVCTASGAAALVARNPPGEGAAGELDSPSECIRLGNKVYVSNIDLTFGPHTADETHTLSIIDL